MAIEKLNYIFTNKKNPPALDQRKLNKETFQGMADKIDELIDFSSDSSNWVKVMEGFQYRKRRDLVEMYAGSVIDQPLKNGEWITLYTLPEEYRPLTIVAFPAMLRKDKTTYLIGLVQIMTSGIIRVSQRTGENINVDSIWFTTIYSVNS